LLLVYPHCPVTGPARHAARLAALGVGLFALAVALPGVAVADHQGSGCGFPVTETDATGTEVTVEEPAEDVVVLDASSAQVFWEIGAQDRVVGMPVEDFTAYLEGSTEKTDVTDGQQVLVERVVELEPDLVLAPNYLGEETMTQLRGAGLTVYQLPLEDSFEAIYRKTALYGHVVGECEAANDTVAETRAEVEELREAVAGRDRPRVLYFFFGFAAGDGTFINDLVETAGGRNVAAEAGVDGHVELSKEVVAERDPEWIVAPSHAGLPEGEPFESTTAFERNQTLVVDENLVSQAGPRVVVPLRTMAETFHPEAFESNGTGTPTPSPAPGDAGPGFGALAALVALVATVILARR
jgi:iron complex transport system substrate-binding protein